MMISAGLPGLTPTSRRNGETEDRAARARSVDNTDMNKAFTRESDQEDNEEPEAGPVLPAGTKNYITRHGFNAMRTELDQLVKLERPRIVETVAWAASNGDRSENGDYIYGKKRLREIDRRVRFLIKRMEIAEVVDPATREACDQVFFGATVTFRGWVAGEAGVEESFQVVGVDEADASSGRISWISPIGRALLKAHVGDRVRFDSPAGARDIEIVDVVYQ
jgi:transcription elongation factor GreB